LTHFNGFQFLCYSIFFNRICQRKITDSRGFVFSTDPTFQFQDEHSQSESLSPRSRAKANGKVRNKASWWKAVTLVLGFVGKNEELEELGKTLKKLLRHRRICERRREYL
jgi:hypothetical protein